MENKTALGKLIRTVRERSHLTSRELARQLGVSSSTLSQWEHGSRMVEDTGLLKKLFALVEMTKAEQAQALELRGVSKVNVTRVDDIRSIDNKIRRLSKQAEELSRSLAMVSDELAELRARESARHLPKDTEVA